MTTYYIRTIADEFSYNLQSAAYGFSRNSHFETFNASSLGDADNPYGMRTNRLFDTTTQRLYYLTANSARNSPPVKAINTISTITITGGSILWSNRFNDPVNSTVTGWRGTYWNTQGWIDASSNYSGWVSELCSYFDSLNPDSVLNFYSNINLVIFKWTFPNTPASGNFFVFPIFYVGNDPARDSTVTV
jgi:hypothetical protein